MVNAANQLGDPASVLEHYRTLIALRHTLPVVTEGDFELLVPDHQTVWAFLRRGLDADLLIAANCSATPAVVPLPLRSDWEAAVVVLTNLAGPSPELLPELHLRPWESVVWRRSPTSGDL
jgi:oligo-1,6-glucosidase